MESDETEAESTNGHASASTTLVNGRAAQDGEHDKQEGQPSWYSPLRLLMIFCAVNMLNYIDRGAIASNGVNGQRGNSTCLPDETCHTGYGIQGDFDLSNFADGVLPAAFMVGLLIACPLFAQLAKSWNPFRLIGVGLTVWTIAVAGCGLSPNFWSLTFCRMFVGVGEASFVSLAAPFIDDNAPPRQKSSWLAAFYMCIPVGIAAGYIFGGVVASSLSWRAAFFIEALAMVPFCIFGFVAGPVALRGASDAPRCVSKSAAPPPVTFWQGTEKHLGAFLKDSSELAMNSVYRINVLGYIAYTFVMGCLAYWGPKAATVVFNMASADEIFGGVTVSMGILGTISGGLILDAVGSSLTNAFALNAASIGVGAVFCLGAFQAPTTLLFIPCLAVGEFFLFISQGPASAITLWSVPSKARPFACAMLTVVIHLFGDVPSPPLLGLFQDEMTAKLGNERLAWRVSLSVLTLILFLTVILWGRGACIAGRATDYRSEADSEENGAEPSSPLLGEPQDQLRSV